MAWEYRFNLMVKSTLRSTYFPFHIQVKNNLLPANAQIISNAVEI